MSLWFWIQEWMARDAWPLVALVLLAGLSVAIAGARRLPFRWQWLWWPSQLALVIALLALLRPPAISVSLGATVLITDGAPLPSGSEARTVLLAAERVDGLDADDAAARRGSGSVAQFAGRLPSELDIRGFGLSAQQWYEVSPPSRAEFEPAEAPGHILSIDLPLKVPAGAPTSFSVTLEGVPADAEVRLEETDGALVASTNVGEAQLELPALAAGRYVYSLSVRERERVLDAVTFGVVAESPPTARLLFLQDAPSFEWRYLQAWVATSGAALAIRTRVSEERFTSRFVHRDATNLSILSDELLSEIDLVVLDGATLDRLVDAERQRLLDMRHGAGVLILLHDAGDLASAASALPGLTPISTPETQIYQLTESRAQVGSGLSRINVEFDPEHWVALRRDLAGTAVVVQGKREPRLAVSSVRDSYRIHGAAGSGPHARFWAGIVETLARPVERPQLFISDERPLVFDRLQVCVASEYEQLQVFDPQGTELRMSLTPVALRLGERCAWLWPTQAGWYRFVVGDLATDHYVGTRDDWRARNSRQALAQTAIVTSVVNDGLATQSARRPLPRSQILPWALLLLVLGWTIQRLAFVDW